MATRGVPRERRAISLAPAAIQRKAENPRRALRDRRQLVDRVVIEVLDDPESVAQRRAEKPHPRRGTDQAEPRKVEAYGTRTRSRSHHQVEGEILHRRIQDLLEGPAQSVDLVHEEDFPTLEVAQDCCQVPGLLDGRPRGDSHRDIHLPTDDVRQGRLAEPWRAVEEHVVEGLFALLRRVQEHAQVTLEPLLPHVLVQRTGPEGLLEEQLFAVHVASDQAVIGHVRTSPHQPAQRRPQEGSQVLGVCEIRGSFEDRSLGRLPRVAKIDERRCRILPKPTCGVASSKRSAGTSIGTPQTPSCP